MNLRQLGPNPRARLDAGSASCYISDATGPGRVSAGRSDPVQERGASPPILTLPVTLSNALFRKITLKNPLYFASDTYFTQYLQGVNGLKLRSTQ